MSTTIDQRVVEMRFDNKNFESNVATTMSTLNNLKQNLKMSGATQGLENVNAAAKNVNMSGLSSAIDAVHSKFSALEVMGITALANITNSAVNAGKRIVSALTIDPIKTGFEEYETQINAVQTILANTESKGTTLDDVNEALDTLNTYADKTIYNFTEMTRNIGTFTAAGIDLDTSVTAIQGIANLAAVSGSTSQQASTAMYQLSQALASGTVKLMDWNSVVNAGMGGQVFQDALKETARVHGIAIDDMITEQGSFRETLSEGWLTSEILTETLEKFTMTTEGLTEAEIEKNRQMLKSKGYTEEQIDEIFKLGETATNAATKVKTFTQLWDTLKEAAQSGWTQTWEILVGDFEEAKELLTSISDSVGNFINSMSEARNNLLQGWKDSGGRVMLIESFKNAFEGIVSVVKPIRDAFKEIFPAITVNQLIEITEKFKSFTEKLKLSETASNNVKRTFKGLFAIIDILRKAFVFLWQALSPVVGLIVKLGGVLLSATAYVGDFFVGLNNGISKSKALNTALEGVRKVVQVVVSVFKGLIGVLGGCFSGFDRLKERMSQIRDAAGDMKTKVVNAISSMGDAIANSTFFKVLQTLWTAVKTIAVGIGKAIGTLVKGLVDPLATADFNGIMDFVNAIISGGIGVGIIKFLKSMTSIFEGLTDFKDGIVDVFDGVKGCLEGFQTQLKAGTLIKIATAVAILAGSILVISLIDSSKLAASLGAITTLFADLMASMAIFSKISGNMKGVTKATTAMVGISIAVLILASALKTVSEISAGNMVTGLLGVLALTAIVVGAAKALSKSGKMVIKGATQMIIFAAAIKILASVCEDLGALSWSEMTKGLVGVGVLMAEISLFLKTANFSGKAITTATGIVLLAAAIKILASACGTFGQMAWNEIGKGLTAIGALLAEIVIFTKLTGDAKNVLSTGIALIAISAAMKIFASAMQSLSSMSWEGLAKGLAAMAGGLLAITLALNFMPEGMVSKAVGLIGVSTALLILSQALNSMGSMSWEGIAKSLVTLSGAMLVLAVALNFMQGTLAGSAALLVAAAALAVLTPVLLVLGAMSWTAIGKGLLTIAGAFAVLGIAGLVLGHIVPVILALAGALALVGIGVVSVGAGLLALSIAMTAFAGMTTATAAAVVATLNIIVSAIIGFIPMIIVKIGEGIIAILNIIAQSGDAICSAAVTIIVSLIDALKVAIPPLMELVYLVLDELIALLVTYIPKLVDAGMKIILGFLDGISSHIADVVDTALEIIANFLRGLGKGIPKVVDAGIKMVIDFINGMADSIRENTGAMIDAVNNLMDAFIGAIKAWFSNAVTNGSELIANVIDGVKSGIAGIKQAGKDAVQGFINGFKEKVSGAWNAAKELGSSALNGLKEMLGINSPSKEFAELGRYSDEGLIQGLSSYSKKVSSAASDVGKSALASMKDVMAGAVDAISGSIDAQPTIRPVVDLSYARSGVAALSSLFDTGTSIGVSANVGAISTSMNSFSQNRFNNELFGAIEKLRKDMSNMNSNSYVINGITYDDGSNISEAVKSLVRAAKIERRT